MSPVDSRLPRYAPGLRGFLGATFVLGVVGTAAVIAQAALIARLVAAVFRGGEGLAQQRETLVLLAGVVIVRAAVAWTQETTAARTAGRVRARLRSLLLRRSFDLGPAWIGERSSMLSRLATHGIDAIDPYVATYLPQLVLAVVAPVLVVVQIGMTDPLSAVIIVVTLPLIPLFGALVGWSTDQRLARQVEALQRLSHHFLDVLDGLPVLRAYRRGHAQRNTIAAATNEYRLATMSVLRLSFLSSFVLELTATLSVAVVAVAIGLRLDNDHLGFQSALFVLILVPEAYLPLRALGASFHTAAEGRAATIEVLDVLEASPSDTTATSPSPPAEPSAEEHAGLRVDNIAVTYVDRPHPAVTEVTLAVGPGELVALVAPSGTGKSTVIAAILGIVAIDAGTVTFDGRRLADTDRSAWWRRIAWV
ncbi:MAG TPA: ABC transporter transmembrane domain-containing protein, partial [Mycobacteriales bacterium]|nr:ABC transporter transmembrane domain-containing protein [Mycobacteriales bacterium]